MKIITKSVENGKSFIEINNGSVFRTKGYFFIKTEYLGYEDDCGFNALKLSDGKFCYFSNDEIVEECNAELHINC